MIIYFIQFYQLLFLHLVYLADAALFDTRIDPFAIDQFTEIVVEIEDGISLEQLQQAADKIGLKVLGKIGSLDGYYMLISNDKLSSVDQLRNIQQSLHYNPHIKSLKTQRFKKRVKRVVDAVDTDTMHWSDPYFNDQWYLNDPKTNTMRIAEVWARGFSGKNVSVTILDDGIQPDHPDLVKNYDANLSSDINGLDDDPTPRDNGNNRHGTRCAGEVAAAGNNSWCGVGIAYNAKIGGVRMLDGRINDRVEAAALSHNPQHIDIYSASWGPDDNGMTVDGPGLLAKKAFAQGAIHGRGGRGNIFVWASGNGGALGDSCSCDGYTTSIYTLSISSTTSNHEKPWYSEECPATLACTYSSGNLGQPAVVTTDMPNSCTKSHTGTSASAPIAAAIVALTLEANPELTWRDLQHIVVMAANPEPLLFNRGWATNAVGRNVSNQFGYGIMDAAAMVDMAQNWTTVSEQIQCTFEYKSEPTRNQRLRGHFKQVFSMDVVGCPGGAGGQIRYLEHVQPVISIKSLHRRGSLQMTLISPSGTRSIILPPRRQDMKGGAGFYRWPFLSVQQWGEDPRGRWMLVLENKGGVHNTASLWHWSLVLYGTEQRAHTGAALHPEHKCDYCQSVTKCNECMGHISFLKVIAPWAPLILLLFLAAIVCFMLISVFKRRWWLFPKRNEPTIVYRNDANPSLATISISTCASDQSLISRNQSNSALPVDTAIIPSSS